MRTRKALCHLRREGRQCRERTGKPTLRLHIRQPKDLVEMADQMAPRRRERQMTIRGIAEFIVQLPFPFGEKELILRSTVRLRGAKHHIYGLLF